MARYEQLANYDMGLVPETVGKTENPNIPWFITMLSAEMVCSGEVFPLSIVERIDLKIWQLVLGRSEMFVATSYLTCIFPKGILTCVDLILTSKVAIRSAGETLSLLE